MITPETHRPEAHARALAEFGRICTGVDMHFGAVIAPGCSSTMRPATRPCAQARSLAPGRSEPERATVGHGPRPAAAASIVAGCCQQPLNSKPGPSLACGATELVNGRSSSTLAPAWPSAPVGSAGLPWCAALPGLVVCIACALVAGVEPGSAATTGVVATAHRLPWPGVPPVHPPR